MTTVLHLIHPIARLRGRIQEGLTPWRRRCPTRAGPLWPVTASVWSEQWVNHDRRLWALEAELRANDAWVVCGECHTRWDLEVRAGYFGAGRLLMGVEEHLGGRQLIRVRWWPTVPVPGPLLMFAFAALALGAAGDQAWVAAGILGLSALASGARIVTECAGATAMIQESVERLRRGAT